MNENIIVAITKLNEIVTDIDKDDTCFLDIKDTVEEVIALLKAKDTNVPTKWISVKDRLPEITGEYIVCAIDEDGEQFVTSDQWLGTAMQWYLFDEHTDSVVTHWMPLPEPPKDGENE